MLSSFMPRPASLTLMTTPSGDFFVVTWTCVLGGENASALSMSSVTRCTTSVVAVPVTRSVAVESISTRWYSCTPAIEACSTSLTLRPFGSLGAAGASASTLRESAVRRMRDARWSRRKRLSRRFGSSSSFSSVSIRPSCWLTSEVLRRDRVWNIWLTWVRSSASPAASETASRCRSSTARASWPISSCVVTSIGSISPAVATGTDPADRLGQLLLGHLERALTHPADRVEQQARDEQRQEDRGEQGGER